MAIKVIGTTVIDDSRTLQNLGSALSVSNGGTGAGSFTTNNLLVGNGTSAFLSVSSGSSGNVLTSDGTNWTSLIASGGALTNKTLQTVTSAATTTINLNSGNVVDLTMAANITTLSFTNVPASGTPILVMIVVKNASDGTAYTITWPNSVYWSGQYAATTVGTVQTAPTLATGANGVTVIALLTTDGGTKWRGWVDATIPGGSANSLYTWGDASPSLGQNALVYRSSAVQVGASTNWATISSDGTQFLAVKTDGTLWAWGSNSRGALGLGDTTNRSSPVQVGALTNWSKVDNGNDNSSFAIKTDGTLWSWGYNTWGTLGLNNTTDYSSPKQVGALTTWAKLGCGYKNGRAIKTDGTLWNWGRNGYGTLGLNNVTPTSSPFPVFASPFCVPP